jgi:hypothetical protein
MIRTDIRAGGLWPETSTLTGQARAVPECLTIATAPLAARDFLVRAEQRVTVIREECCRGARIFAQIEAAIVFFFSMAQVSTRRKLKGNYALHGHTVTVEWVGGPLRTPLIVVYVPDRAQIGSLYDDGVPKRARKRSRVRVRGWCYPEAAAASSTSTNVGTECELIDCSRVPIHSLAARYRRTSRSACGPGGMDESRRIAYRHIGNRCTR